MVAARLDANTQHEPNSGCWLWDGATDTKGYGHVVMNGRRVRAHRASYALHRGPIPPGRCVCHKCDTPACINPAHLVLATHAANRGEKNGLTSLTDEAVRGIRHDLAAGELTGRAIACRYGVSAQTISNIKAGKVWSHVR